MQEKWGEEGGSLSVTGLSDGEEGREGGLFVGIGCKDLGEKWIQRYYHACR